MVRLQTNQDIVQMRTIIQELGLSRTLIVLAEACGLLKSDSCPEFQKKWEKAAHDIGALSFKHNI